MNRHRVLPANRPWISRFLRMFAVTAACAAAAASMHATDVVLIGTAQFQVSGSSVILSVPEISNLSTSGTSGTLRVELWAFASPFTGGSQTGYRLAIYVPGTLMANYYFPPFTETVAYAPPPNGSWYYSMLLTEYTDGPVDNGYTWDDYVDFPNAVQVGPVTTPPPPPASTTRLTNLSVRSTAGTGSQTLIGGFVIGGSGSKKVLARGDGPALTAFGVTGVLPDPVLTLYNSAPSEIGANAGWGGGTTLSGVFSQVGAFALPANSKDAAILTTLAAGAYTANITSTSGDSGVVLVEVYDADTGTPPARFINLSARSEAGTASQTLIAGFAISGTGTETVLIRGDGPALSVFGVTGVLAAPMLTLFDGSGKAIATNTGWGNASTKGASSLQASTAKATSAVFTEVGAFKLPANSADCAIVASLPAGAYTAQVTGVNNTTGVALVEIYEVPQSSGGGGPVITSQPLSQNLSSGGGVTLSVTVSGSATFQWYLNGNPIPGATGSSYIATAAGTYTVVATNGSGSTTSSAASVSSGNLPPPTGIDLTGTWTGQWTEQYVGSSPSSGWCDAEYWNVTWVLTQSGSNVSGTYTMTVTGLASDALLCPDSPGDQEAGTISGTVTGNAFTLITDGGTQFSGTITGTTLAGLGSSDGPNAVLGDSSTGTFTINQQ
ncbi:MAG TPA: immunoglobulin domain-containing protein [Isosphaeraceae bacterium]|nr:immunoglobulin domain-containing protein [Isosphaeraceae bacterium]